MAAAEGGTKLVVRNTFLELYDDAPALGPVEGRPRAQTDLTDSKMPQKVDYPSNQNFGKGTSAAAGSYMGDVKGSPLPVLSEEPLTVPFTEDQSGEATSSGGMGPYSGVPAWGYPGYSGHDQAGVSGSLGMSTMPRDTTEAARSSAALPVGSAPTEVAADRPLPDSPTTVMLRNIPNRYTQGMLLGLLHDHNFDNTFDFVYLPMDFRNGVNLGYAFVNLLTHEDALRLMNTFQGYSAWTFDSAKVCEVSWAHPHQGLAEHVERYRSSPVMHPCMPDEYKPLMFKDGVRVPFPPPTKAIRAPKLRPARPDKAVPEGN
mmetsp:Transcript_19296/g.42041  ORF Transcript_19296/g.42041 Transcript_19296/m.42041 type:complete len:316 (+) Transcript_19296:66-1013(+)|eukprot:CAMPEP_0170609188 /NCGR_PEP_ID=MMETSP0224-20130122/21987_1 /TAXON_ID=285029 /ORGANISM="Togula jolla, Strain CCCM 725" /LENGTH=315 /DNA_ID=CAMNT_0010934469 /DNA_START=37 /DNA_END=984 /DNA_ORIENTATION=-